jgi:hypothetical protein
MRLNPPETLVILFGLQGTSRSFDRKKEKGEDVRFRTILAQGQPLGLIRVRDSRRQLAQETLRM